MANLSNIVTGQVTTSGDVVQRLSAASVGTVAGVLVTASVDCFIGNTNVTPSTGLLVPAKVPTLIPVDNVDQLWAITPSSSSVISWMAV